MSLLDQINGNADLQKLKIEELSALAQEIRARIIEVTKANGGHLASNLGIVETTIALHRCFDFSKDKIVFDVGHQCYAHKLLSGRGEVFSSIRTSGGISGFPDAEESAFDSFSTGHAGTSISAALGLCQARDMLGEDYTVVAVVGDGSLSNGLNLEALNASNDKPKNFIVIVNDNGMSISKNKNGFYKLISKSTTKRGYVKSKRAIKKIFGNSFVTKFLRKIREFVKRVFNRNNYFEKLGFKYVGVLDGNNLNEMQSIMPRIKNVAKEQAILLHVKTTKGKGLAVAEQNSEGYHGVGKNHSTSLSGFAETLGEALNQIIERDSKVVAVTAGMKKGTGLDAVEEKHASNFIDVGIAEEYAVTLAAGMAKGGLKPVVAVYSTFLQRAYDQILHDVCAQNLPVVFCIDRAGFVGEDGKTHQGLFDLSFLSHIPNLTVLTPVDERDLKYCLDYALGLNSPVAIRYPKKGEKVYDGAFDGAKWVKLRDGDFVTLLAVGPRMIKNALEVCSRCKGVSVVAVRSVVPLDCELLDSLKGKVVTLEENVLSGGFGQTVTTYYAQKENKVKVYTLGVDGQFVKHGNVDSQMKQFGLDVCSLEKFVNSL